MSLAVRVTSPPACTSESTMPARALLATALPMAVSCTAKPPEPETPTDRARMTASESAVRDRDASVTRSVSPTEDSTELAMTLAAMATPTAPPPVPETPTAMVLISEESAASRVTAPPASILLRSASVPWMEARVVSVMTLADRDRSTAAAPEPATPTLSPRISDELRA
ncbi:hypothetical protein DSECCO2_456690 [anaerobic digester metagenome]